MGRQKSKVLSSTPDPDGTVYALKMAGSAQAGRDDITHVVAKVSKSQIPGFEILMNTELADHKNHKNRLFARPSIISLVNFHMDSA